MKWPWFEDLQIFKNQNLLYSTVVTDKHLGTLKAANQSIHQLTD